MTLLSSKHPFLTRTEELIVAFTSLWFIGGLYLDGWAHNHIPELETFFTPWHGVFYTGFFASAVALFWITAKNKKKSKTWFNAIPAGYEYAVYGAILFALGGIADVTWHTLLGIENDIEALHSPPHLVLATGMVLIFSGGLRAWWKKGVKARNGNYLEQLPMILSVTFIYSMLVFMTQYAHLIDLDPAGDLRPREDFYLQALPMLGFMLHFAMLMGLTFIIMRRGKPAFGFITTVLGVNILAMGLMRENAILVTGAVFTGLISDYMLQKLYPLEKHMAHIRMFAFGVPAVFMAFYFGYIMASQGTWWTVHMSAGAVFMAGISGLLMSVVAWPPAEE